MTTARPKPAPRRRPNYRALITNLVALSFLVMLTSGIVMFIAPSGKIAKSIGWTLMGIGRAEWQALHLSFAIVFVGFGTAHLIVNWRALMHHIRSRTAGKVSVTWQAAVALAVTAWLAASAMLQLPPVTYLQDLNRQFRKTFWSAAQPDEMSISHRDFVVYRADELPVSRATVGIRARPRAVH